jgi:hypothetical protein
MIVDLIDYRRARFGYGAPRDGALRWAEVTDPARDLIAFAQTGAPPAIWDRLHEAFPSPPPLQAEARPRAVRLVFCADAAPRLEACE